MDLVSGLEKLVAQLTRQHFILIHQLGLLGQQTPHQRVNFTCKGDPDAMLGVGQVGISSIAGHTLLLTVSLSQVKDGLTGPLGLELGKEEPSAAHRVCGGWRPVHTACHAAVMREHKLQGFFQAPVQRLGSFSSIWSPKKLCTMRRDGRHL